MLDVLFDPNNYPFWILIIATLAGAIAIISRPFSTYVKFVYPNAKFEAIGNPFVTEKELSRVVDNKNLNDFKEALNGSKDYNVSGDNIYEIQHSLDDNFIQTIEMMRKDSSKKMNEFYDTYIEKLDVYLIKNAIKNKLDDKEIDEKITDQAILPSTKTLILNIADSEKENLPEILKNHGFGKEILEIFSEENIDYMKLDTAFDKHIMEKISQVKVPYKCDKAKQRFVNNFIDIANIKNTLRAKQLGYDAESIEKLFIGEGQEVASWKLKEISEADSVPQAISSLEGTSYYDALKNAIEDYNKEKSVQVLENALDRHFLKLVKNISLQNYSTIGPTLRFIVSKEFEVKNLKIITKGIGEGLSSDFIKHLFVLEAGA
ncbi:MAG: V-type ATPase subunit [Thermoplasmatales archaeon]|nr:V-type ATPase subunit [Thermoplasmatales archaeon]